MINEDKYTRAILVNDRMSRVISLSYVNKTNAHKVNKKILILRIQDDYASFKRRKSKEKFLFLRRFFFHTYRI
jgi:DNA-directed RNA polymerase